MLRLPISVGCAVFIILLADLGRAADLSGATATTAASQPTTAPATAESQPVTAASTEPVPKVPVPAGAALAKAVKMANELYADEVRKARTIDQRMDLANKILHAAQNQNEAAGRFALLAKARDMAVINMDFDGAAAAIDQLDGAFIIDALKMKADAALMIEKAAKVGQQRTLAAALPALVDMAVMADRFALAVQLADLSLGCARAAQESAMAAAAAEKVRDVHQIQVAFTGVKAALATLAAQPKDPVANLKVGRYRSFIKGDWDAGLPLLAQGSDVTIKELAAQELAGAATAQQQQNLGDGWWDIAEKETGITRTHIKQHAAKWYALAEPNVQGLAKIRGDKRINEVEAGQAATAATIDLMKMVDIEKDTVAGPWKMRGGTLISGNVQDERIEFPYQPGPEYDFRVEFARNSGAEAVFQYCTGGGHPFELVMDGWTGTIYGMEMIGNKAANSNGTTRLGLHWIAAGQRYVSVVKVRKGGIQTFLNGKLMTEWKTDFSDMAAVASRPLRDPTILGIGSWASPTTFYSAELIEVTGHGRRTR